MPRPFRLLAALVMLLPLCCHAVEDAGAATGPGSAAATVPAVATPLGLLIGELPLPFSYRLVSDEIGISNYLGLTTSQDIEILPVDGPRAGKPLRLRIRHVVPANVSQGLVQSLVQGELEKFAADARTRVIKPVRIEGFEFTVADTYASQDDTEVRTVRLMGQVGGSLVNVFVTEELEGDGPSALVDILGGLELDYTATLRFRARLEAEAKRAIAGDRLLTPVGVLDEPKGIDARLNSAFATYDGSGRLVGATQSFSFHKVGFWSVQSFGVTVGCTLGPPRDEAARKRLIDPFDPDDDRLRRVSSSRDRVGGVPARKLEVELTSRTGMKSLATRWYAEAEDSHYVVRIDRINSRVQQIKLEEQLTAMAFRCDPESMLGMPPTADTLAAPPTPPADAG